MKRAGRVHYIDTEFSGTGESTVQGFTTRHEGISRPPYNSLNLGTTTLDASSNVEGNRSILARSFGIGTEKLVTVRQVHGSDILVIDEHNEDYSHFFRVESDAIITNQTGVMIGICVADCAPILLFDPHQRVIAAVHAGWQGTAAKVVAQTISGMQSLFGSRPQEMLASIGPCIGKCCYEVDAPVRKAFEKSGFDWNSCADAAGVGKWMLDLPAANRELIVSSGLPEDAVQVSDMCVCCHRELFFSYRRDGGDTGRQMGFIMLNG
jgi:YfiH family protein